MLCSTDLFCSCHINLLDFLLLKVCYILHTHTHTHALVYKCELTFKAVLEKRD